MITFNECIEYVLANRKGNAFRDFTREDIYATIQASAQAGAFCYVVHNDKIVGLVTGVPHEAIQQLHITQILTTHKGALREMVSEFRARFPGWTLSGTRKGSLSNYGARTKTLCNRLSKQHLQ